MVRGWRRHPLKPSGGGEGGRATPWNRLCVRNNLYALEKWRNTGDWARSSLFPRFYTMTSAININTKNVSVDQSAPFRSWRYRPISDMSLTTAISFVGDRFSLWSIQSSMRSKLDTYEEGRPCWNISRIGNKCRLSSAYIFLVSGSLGMVERVPSTKYLFKVHGKCSRLMLIVNVFVKALYYKTDAI